MIYLKHKKNYLENGPSLQYTVIIHLSLCIFFGLFSRNPHQTYLCIHIIHIVAVGPSHLFHLNFTSITILFELHKVRNSFISKSSVSSIFLVSYAVNCSYDHTVTYQINFTRSSTQKTSL